MLEEGICNFVFRLFFTEFSFFNFYPSYIGQEKTITNSTLPHLCAHRGVSHACPENTLTAFGAAIAMGVQEIELDLHLSSKQ